MMVKLMIFIVFFVIYGIKIFLMVLLLKLEIVFFISCLYFFENDRILILGFEFILKRNKY